MPLLTKQYSVSDTFISPQKRLLSNNQIYLRAGSQRGHFPTWKEQLSLRVNKLLLKHPQTLFANLRYVVRRVLYTQK